jgi:hypothetical protein
MTNTFYDDFKAMTAERMAGSMEDMTYAYEQTRVPKAHYRKMLYTVADHIEQAVQFGREGLECISFNRSMIAKQDSKTVSIWVPGTKRTKRITVPRERLVIDGQTIRAWLPRDSDQVLGDRQGRLAQLSS